MKHYTTGKVQIVSYDPETEENYSLSLGNLVENADVEAIDRIAKSLDTIIAGDLAHATVTENYHISL